tara:strand:- start:9817 stop:11787 length:1971 start_codon:yes stop_codon:yes gene_type:complete
MCGIVGVVSKIDSVALESFAERMCSAIQHRGPDSSGVWVDKNCSLAIGHQRLAIQDLTTAGAQPMRSKNGRFHIVFNGEVYNFSGIRKALEARGYNFEGHSDTEVLLESISEWGLEASLKMFEGMFAFGLWDQEEKKLSLCRDRLGEKPLYYGWLKEKFVFGSELGAIEAIGETLKINRDALAEYFYYGYVPAPHSIYQGLYKLLPGTYLTFDVENGKASQDEFTPYADKAGVSPKTYWSVGAVLANSTPKPASVEGAIDGFDLLLKEVVSDQAAADVPLGAFLSGGIDSTSIVAILKQVNTIPTQTFTIGFKEKGFNEATFAKDIAKHLGTEHTELYISAEDCLDLVSKLPHIYDEPLADSSQIPSYFVSGLARQHVTVCLSGDGGDELFAGYNRYAWLEKFWQKQTTLPLFARKLLAALLSGVPVSLWDNAYNAMSYLFSASSRQNNVGLKIQKITELLKCRDVTSAYRYLISYWQESNFPLLHAKSIDVSLFDSAHESLTNFVERAMYWDQLSYLPGDNLTKVDRASMAHSLETRLPLLNHRVVEYAWNTPLSMKVREGQSKWLLRQVLYKYVPKEMIERPKMGFSVPIAEWLRGPLKSWAENLIADLDETVFDKAVIQQTFQLHLSGKLDCSNRLWALLVFWDWFRSRDANL